MRKIDLITLLIFIWSACDDGNIYPQTDCKETGRSIQCEIYMTGIGGWPIENDLAIAVFNTGNSYPSISKIIEKPEKGSSVTATLNRIPADADYISIVLIGKSRNPIYTFCTYILPESDDKTTILPTQEIDLLAYSRLQKQLFDQCTACHGGSNQAASNLFLTAEKSYGALVGKQAVHSTKKLVTPNAVNRSFLIDVLEGTATLSPDHSKMSALTTEDMQLLKAWIHAGAKN